MLKDRDNVILGFADECSPQSSSCTARLWGFSKPRALKNTNRLTASTIGFYALNGQSYAACYPDLRKENFCSFLRQVRERNPRHHILIILDNSRVHTCIEASMTAWELNISFLHLPYYSPHLNPIEKIWKQIKRIFTPRLLRTKTEMTNIITNEFNIQTKTNSHAKKWIRTILEDKYKKLHNYDQLYKYKN